jgi:hypothetical protein
VRDGGADAESVGGGFQDTALALDAEGFADDLDRNPDLEALVRLDLVQIDVEVFVGDGIALDFLEEGQGDLGAVGILELDQDRAAEGGLDQAAEFAAVAGLACFPYRMAGMRSALRRRREALRPVWAREDTVSV